MKNVIDKVTDSVSRRTTKKECVIFYLPSGVYLRRAAPCRACLDILLFQTFPDRNLEGPGVIYTIVYGFRQYGLCRVHSSDSVPRPPGGGGEDWFKKCSRLHSFTKRTAQTSLIIFVRQQQRANRVYVTIHGSNGIAVKKITK